MALFVHVLSVLCVAVVFASGQSDSNYCDNWCEFPIGSERFMCCKDVGCVFGNKIFKNIEYLNDVCLTMQCKSGTWNFVNINQACGTCNAHGDPHIVTFEKSLGPSTKNPIVPKYLLNTAGEYVITQPGFSHTSPINVKATFKSCDYLANIGYKGICITKISYHEPGIEVTLELPSASIAARCVTDEGAAQDPACAIKVLVNKMSIGQVGSSSKTISSGLGGAIVVFKHGNIIGVDNLNCIAVVGTQGFSVSLCLHKENYPFFYIWAMSSLKSEKNTPLTSQLHGLCNTFTKLGATSSAFVMQNGTSVPSIRCLTSTTKDGGGYDICYEFSHSWWTQLKRGENKK